MLKTLRLQLVIHSIMHGTTLTLIKLDSVSFLTCRLDKKKWCDFEAINVSCMVCIKRNATRFSTLQTKTNSLKKRKEKKGFSALQTKTKSFNKKG